MLKNGPSLERVSAVACFKSGVRLAFAPDAREGVNRVLECQKWQGNDRRGFMH